MPEQQVSISTEAYMQMQQEAWNRYILENQELLETIRHLLLGELETPVEKTMDNETVVMMQWVKPEGKKPPMNMDGYYFTMLHLKQGLE